MRIDKASLFIPFAELEPYPSPCSRRYYRPGEVPAQVADTSRAAANNIANHLGDCERRTLEALSRAHDGLTVEGVELVSGLSRLTAGARLTTLSRRIPDPLVAKTDRRERLRSGNSAIVWEITEAGRRALAGGGL